VPPATPGPATTPGAPPPPPQPGGTGLFASLRRSGLYRSDERWIGGVAGGLAQRFGVDPLLVRGIFAVTTLLGGLGLIAYALAWALLPEQRDGRIHLEGLSVGHPDIALLGALLMLLAGLGRGSWGFDGTVLPHWLAGLFWLAGIVAVIALISATASSRRGGARPAPYTGPLPTRPAPGAPPWAGAPVPPVGPGSPATTSPLATAAPTATPTTVPVYGTPPPAPWGPNGPMPTSAAPAGGPYGSSYGSAYGAPYGAPYGPARGGPTTAPMQPPLPVVRAPRRPRNGPGAPLVGVAVAVSLLTFAAVLISERLGWFDGRVLAVSAALAAVVFGLAIAVSGLRGRLGGVLSFFAVIALLIAGPAAAADSADWTWHWSPGSNARSISEGTTTVTSRTTAADGLEISAGDGTIDLSGVPMTDQLLTVPVTIGAGDVTIVVPHGARVSATADVGVGSVTWKVDGADDATSGLGISGKTFSTGGAGDTQLHLNISVGLGDLTIIEEDS